MIEEKQRLAEFTKEKIVAKYLREQGYPEDIINQIEVSIK